MAALIAEIGPPRLRAPMRGRHGHFLSLARSIAYQQLAGKAAATIWSRVHEALGDVTPERVLAADVATLRSAGLSAAKTAALLDLAAAVTDGRLDLQSVARRPDDAVIADVIQVRGIGPWTAQMFLLFQLRRPDVWPTTDLGVRRGFAVLYGLRGDPSPEELEEAGERYRPWRSVAAWYMWRAVDTITPG